MIFPQAASRIWKVSPNNEVGIDVIIGNGSNLMKPDLVQTRGVSLRMTNSIMIEKKPIVLQTQADNSTFQNLLAIASDENSNYFVTSQGVFSLSTFSALPTFTALTNTNQPGGTYNRDGVIFNGVFHLAGDTKVAYYTGGGLPTWTNAVTSLSASYPIVLNNFAEQAGLAVGNGNTVYLYNTSYSLVTTLTMPLEYIVTSMVSRGNNLYIATRNISGGGAQLFIWTGTGTAAQFQWPVNADWIYSVCDYNNSVACVTSEGQILSYNGGGFDELENLPVYSTPYSWVSSSSVNSGVGKVAARGMKAIGKRLLINIDGSVSLSGGGFPGNYLPQQPSGLWEYNATNGLFHRAGYCHTKYQTFSVVEVDSGNMVFSSAHNAVTGDPVYIQASGSISGIEQNQVYFAIVTGANALTLALTRADAISGTAITMSGASGGAQVCIDAVNEIGATLIQTVGAIGTFNKNFPNSFFGTEVMFGGSVPNDTGTQTYTLMSLGLGRSRCSFVSARIMTDDPTNRFGQLTVWPNNLLASFEEIIVKVRKLANLAYPTIVSQGTVSPVQWTSNTTFTATALDRDLSQVKIGDECTILQGAGSGYTAHVLTISETAGVWTVVLDEPIGLIVNGNESEVQFDNWTKIKVVNNTDSHLGQGYANINVGKNSAWMQVKHELRGRDQSFDKFSQVNKKANTQN